eukprot:IDg12340t1
METIGLNNLVQGDLELEKKLKKLINWNRWVNWRLVDPCPSTRPKSNYMSASVLSYSLVTCHRIDMRFVGVVDRMRSLKEYDRLMWPKSIKERLRKAKIMRRQANLSRNNVVNIDTKDDVRVVNVDAKDFTEPPPKRRGVDEKDVRGLYVCGQSIAGFFLPVLGKRKRSRDSTEIRFILIEEQEQDINEHEESPKSEKFKTIAEEMFGRVSSRTQILTHEAREEWLKFFVSDLVTICESVTAHSNEGDKRRGLITEECLELMLCAR